MDRPRDHHAEWNKSERGKHIIYNECVWNLERWYRWSYLQSRSRDADVENKRMDTKRKGGGAGSLGLTHDTNDTVDKIDGWWEATGERRELHSMPCSHLKGNGVQNKRSGWTHTADSLCCAVEMKTPLQHNSTPAADSWWRQRQHNIVKQLSFN